MPHLFFWWGYFSIHSLFNTDISRNYDTINKITDFCSFNRNMPQKYIYWKKNSIYPLSKTLSWSAFLLSHTEMRTHRLLHFRYFHNNTITSASHFLLLFLKMFHLEHSTAIIRPILLQRRVKVQSKNFTRWQTCQAKCVNSFK